ncbi:MAG: hypothetical protein KAJ78_03935 [Acidobacteria bacterium]|nr:hypothetical protein [Acidobacteriota bacterium]
MIATTGDGLCRASDLLLSRRREPPSSPLITDIPGLDTLLGGGLARGSLTELVGRPSSGRFATLLTVLQRITSSGEPAALIDQGAHLDPQSAAAAGIDLERLLWVCPKRLPDTLAAAELLVATGFPLVAIDLGLPPVKGRAPLAAWLRLARRTAEYRVVALVGAPYRVSGCAASTVVIAGKTRGRWSGRPGAVRTLEGLRSRLELSKHRDHQPEASVRLTLTLPGAAFGAPAENEPLTTIDQEEFYDVQSQ